MKLMHAVNGHGAIQALRLRTDQVSADQLLAADSPPGTFEYTLSFLNDNKIDLSVFDDRYQNDANGAPAHGPALLINIALQDIHLLEIVRELGISKLPRDNSMEIFRSPLSAARFSKRP
jgi:hypothetical protein